MLFDDENRQDNVVIVVVGDVEDIELGREDFSSVFELIGDNNEMKNGKFMFSNNYIIFSPVQMLMLYWLYQIQSDV